MEKLTKEKVESVYEYIISGVGKNYFRFVQVARGKVWSEYERQQIGSNSSWWKSDDYSSFNISATDFTWGIGSTSDTKFEIHNNGVIFHHKNVDGDIVQTSFWWD